MKLLLLNGVIAGQNVNVLIDSGARRDLISDRLQRKLALPSVGIRLGVTYSNRTRSTLTRKCNEVLDVGLYSQRRDFVVAPVPFDVILGKAWLEEHNPRIDWRTNTVEFEFEGAPVKLVCT